MKTFFIPVKYSLDTSKDSKKGSKLEKRKPKVFETIKKELKKEKFFKFFKKVGLITTIQYIPFLNEIKKILQPRCEVFLAKAEGLEIGQILGCNVEAAKKLEEKVDAFIYVGSGIFHPLVVATSLKIKKPIFIINPITETFSKIDEKEIQKAEVRKKTAKIKFLTAKNCGILISIKQGQEKLKTALKIKRELEKKHKRTYIFLFDILDTNQFENFSDIECWVNTACPGLSIEYPFIWFNDIKL